MNGQDLRSASDTLLRMAKQHDGLLAAASALMDVGTLEGRAAEAASRVEASKEEIKSAEQRLVELNAKAVQANDEAEKIIRDANSKAEKIAEEAKNTVKLAEEKAAQFNCEAATAQKLVDTARVQLADIETKTEAAKAAARKILS